MNNKSIEQITKYVKEHLKELIDKTLGDVDLNNVQANLEEVLKNNFPYDDFQIYYPLTNDSNEILIYKTTPIDYIECTFKVENDKE